MIINIKNINKIHSGSLRPQLLLVLDRLLIVCEFKRWFSPSDQNLLKNYCAKIVDDLIHLMKFHKVSGFKKFKDKVNYLIHMALLAKHDKNIKRTFRIQKYYYKILKLIKITSEFGLIRRNIVISILQIWRVIKFPVSINIEDIIEPYNGRLKIDGDVNELEELESLIQECCKIYQNKVTKPKWNFDLNLYLSSGPNGGYASGKVIPDFASIFNSNIQENLDFIYSNDASYKGICERILMHKEYLSISKPEDYIHSRLHFLQDKGGKTRNIAIADQFTQMGLLPLHKCIFALLRKLSCDGTKDQTAAVNKIFHALKLNSLKKLFTYKSVEQLDLTFENQLNLTNKFYSIDMRSCTERFPVFFQRIVLNKLGILTKEESLAWEEIISKRDFTYWEEKEYTERNFSRIWSNQKSYPYKDLISQYRRKQVALLNNKTSRLKYFGFLKKKFKMFEKKPFWQLTNWLKNFKVFCALSLYLDDFCWTVKVRNTLRFAVGQPMGIYSSWATMAISHHILVQLSCYTFLLSNISKTETKTLKYHYFKILLQKFLKYGFNNYRILGDDIVIFDENIAIEYLLWLQKIGIKVSIEKCFISDKVCEFAKRFITLTNVINTVSVTTLYNVNSNITLSKKTAKHRAIGELALQLSLWSKIGFSFSTENLTYAVYLPKDRLKKLTKGYPIEKVLPKKAVTLNRDKYIWYYHFILLRLGIKNFSEQINFSFSSLYQVSNILLIDCLDNFQREIFPIIGDLLKKSNSYVDWPTNPFLSKAESILRLKYSFLRKMRKIILSSKGEHCNRVSNLRFPYRLPPERYEELPWMFDPYDSFFLYECKKYIKWLYKSQNILIDICKYLRKEVKEGLQPSMKLFSLLFDSHDWIPLKRLDFKRVKEETFFTLTDFMKKFDKLWDIKNIFK